MCRLQRSGNVNDVMHRKRSRRILGILKKSVELRTRLRTGRVDFWGSLRPDEFARYGRRTSWGGGRWKSQHRKTCRKTFKLKGNENFFFRVSGFLCTMYICNEHSMYVSHTHVSGSGTPLVTFLSPKFHKPGLSWRISDDSDIPPNLDKSILRS